MTQTTNIADPPELAVDRDIIDEIICPDGGVCRISSASFRGKNREELLRIKENVERTAGEIG